MMERTSPSPIVNSDLDAEQTKVADASVAELLTVCIARAAKARDDTGAPGAAREYAESITHMEDAITRFNKGTYRDKGTFAITDAERS